MQRTLARRHSIRKIQKSKLTGSRFFGSMQLLRIIRGFDANALTESKAGGYQANLCI